MKINDTKSAQEHFKCAHLPKELSHGSLRKKYAYVTLPHKVTVKKKQQGSRKHQKYTLQVSDMNTNTGRQLNHELRLTYILVAVLQMTYLGWHYMWNFLLTGRESVFIWLMRNMVLQLSHEEP